MLLRFLMASITTVVFMPQLTLAQGDLVQLAGKAPLSGTIKKMSATEIVLTVNNRDRSIPVNELANVSFRDEPDELRMARRDIGSRKYNTALDKLGKIDRATLRRLYVRQDVEFYSALAAAHKALAGAADPKLVVRQMVKFRKAAPENYHFYESVDVLGQLAMTMGEYKHAQSFFGELARAPWNDYKIRANLLEAQALQRQEKYAEALRKFERVENSNVTGPVADRQKTLAQIGMAICLAETGKPAEGIVLADSIIDDAAPNDTELNAKAFNALGNCYLKENKAKDALLAFLHTDILYPAQQDAHAEALFHLTNLWDQIDRKDRALNTRSILKARYANSLWAKKL